ncbi:MAG: PQQ-binding-like beta-propeller repeat protein [Pirellulaceae bacterium]|nr:PQQ-binding-like beta-propeller repeat protein [Pirellulaceae bacterium]
MNTLPRCWSLVFLLLLGWSVESSVSAAEAEADALAARLLSDADVQGGLVVHLNFGDAPVAGLTAALRTNDRFLVHGLDRRWEQVDAARQSLRSRGVYGPVSVDWFDGRNLPYTDQLVKLLIAETLGDVPQDEVLRVLAPGGTALIRRGDSWERTVKPWPPEIDDWTHFLHNASNNAVAQDRVVGPPSGYQWIAGPRWARSHDHLSTLSAMVSARGRIFYIVDEGPTASVAAPPQWQLVARDAFSGVLLWKRPILSWEGHLRGFRSGPTDLARRLVADGDRVYVTLGYGQPVSVLQAATGETIQTYARTDNALEIILHDGVVFVVAGDRPPDNTDGAALPRDPQRLWHWWAIWEETPPRKRLVAVDESSGRVIWEKDDTETAELLSTTLAASGPRLYFQNFERIVSLEARSGRELWRADRPVSRRRPTWSTPTLVVWDEVVLSADRALSGVAADAPDTDRPSQWVVNSSGGQSPTGQLLAFSAETGQPLWEAACRECYNAPVDVLVADGLVWSGDLVSKRDPGITVGRDLRTGEIKRERPADQEFFSIVMGHQRCYRNKATEQFLVLGRDGIELIDTASGEASGYAWVRGSCQYGVMPCNGLIYSPPHSCACHIESKLNSFNVLAPARPATARRTSPADPEACLEKGPAYGVNPAHDQSAESITATDWPTYRCDAARRGATPAIVPPTLKAAWDAKLDEGSISSPVIADGRVFVASIQTHTVHALEADSGRNLWSFTAGGRIDSPPTIYLGTAIFGSADGWIYCVRTVDGQLVWRFRAAVEDRRIVSYEQLESAWPLHGSVLVLDGQVYAVAGRTAYLDGGMVLHRLDAATGQSLSATPIGTAALPDVLASDGTSVFLRHRRFDRQGAEQLPNVPHLYSPAGFLDDSWWHRTYWIFGTNMRSGWGAWPDSGNQVPAGRLLVKDDSTVYGFGRFNQYHRNGSHVGMGGVRQLLYAAEWNPQAVPTSKPVSKAGQPKKPAAAPVARNVVARWSRTLPLMARAMVLSDRVLFVAGPPDVLTYVDDREVYAYRIHSEDAVREQQAAFEGQRGGLLLAVSADDGSQLGEYRLDTMPASDAMAAAGGRLYLSTHAGQLLCFAAE